MGWDEKGDLAGRCGAGSQVKRPPVKTSSWDLGCGALVPQFPQELGKYSLGQAWYQLDSCLSRPGLTSLPLSTPAESRIRPLRCPILPPLHLY